MPYGFCGADSAVAGYLLREQFVELEAAPGGVVRWSRADDKLREAGCVYLYCVGESGQLSFCNNSGGSVSSRVCDDSAAEICLRNTVCETPAVEDRRALTPQAEGCRLHDRIAWMNHFSTKESLANLAQQAQANA